MTLYSWFSDRENKLVTRNQDIKDKPHKANMKNEYIESYTMWPTASIIQGKQVVPPTKNDTASISNDTTSVAKPIVISLSTALIVYKA